MTDCEKKVKDAKKIRVFYFFKIYKEKYCVIIL